MDQRIYFKYKAVPQDLGTLRFEGYQATRRRLEQGFGIQLSSEVRKISSPWMCALRGSNMELQGLTAHCGDFRRSVVVSRLRGLIRGRPGVESGGSGLLIWIRRGKQGLV